MNGPLALGFGVLLLLGTPTDSTPADPVKGVIAQVVDVELLAWLDPDRGALEGVVYTVRLENHGAELLTLTPSGAEVMGRKALLRTCAFYTASARRVGERNGALRSYDHVLKPKQKLVVRMVFFCPMAKGKRLTVDRRKTYDVALTLSWPAGRVRTVGKKVTPTLHPGAFGGF